MAEQELSIVIRARNAAKDTLAEIDKQFKGLDVSVADVSASLNQAGDAMATLQRVDQTLLAGSADHFMLIQQSLEQVQVSANSTEAGLKQLDESSTELAATAINTSQQVVIAFTNIEQAGMSSAETVAEEYKKMGGEVGRQADAFQTASNGITASTEESEKGFIGYAISIASAATSIVALNAKYNLWERALVAGNTAIAAVESALMSWQTALVLAGTALTGLVVLLGGLITKALLDSAAAFETNTKSIENMAQSYGESAQEIASALQDASGGVLSFAEAMNMVKSTLDKDVDAEIFVEAMKTARVEAKLTGETFETVYARIAEDIHNGTSKAIEHLGVTVDLEKAYKHFAEMNGQLADDLTETGKKMAVLNANATEHGRVVLALGNTYLSSEEILRQWGVTLKDVGLYLWQQVVEALVVGITGVNIVFNALASTAAFLAERLFKLFGATELAAKANKIYVESLDNIRGSFDRLENLDTPMKELDRPTKDLFDSTARLAKGAEEAGKKLDAAFQTLGVVRVEKEIEKLEEAYQTLESSGVASTSELNQAHDNMLEKIKQLKGEGIDPLVEAFKTLGFQSSKEVEDGLDKMRSAYETLRDSGAASAGDIAQAWQAVEVKQKEVADKANVYAAILKDKIVPAATAYASALAESGKAEVAALKSGLDARFTQVADAAKNAGKSIEGINSAMANKFDTARKATDDLAKAMFDLRSATNAYANDLDHVGNEQYLQYQKLIQSLRDYGASAEQIRQAEIASNKNYKSLLEARIDAERGGLAELVKIRDQNLNNYRQHKEDIKQIDQAIADARKNADDVRAAVSDKGFTTEEKNLRELNRLKTQLFDSELLEGERRLQIIRQIEQKAGQIATSSQANSMEEIRGMALVNEASEKEVALLTQIKDEHETAAKSAVTLAKNTDLAIAKSQELVSGLQEVVRALGQTIANSDLAVKIKLLDEAMEPAKKLKDELKKLFGDDIIQKIQIVKLQPGGNNTDDLTDSSTGDSGGGDSGSGDGQIPGFATGISYVPRDMVARIHQGETILNKQDADRYRSGQIGNVTFGDIHINVPPGVPITRAVAMAIRRELARIDRRVSS